MMMVWALSTGSSLSTTPGMLKSNHGIQDGGERVQKGIAYWDKQNHAVLAPNCVLKVRGEIIKVEGL